jgi:hypothetical protein
MDMKREREQFMDITHFAFAFYVFLLICAVIWFYGRVTGGGKKKDKSHFEKEQRLFQLYQNVEDMLASFEEYAEEAKAGIDERLGQMQAMIEDAQNAAKPKPAARRASTPKPSQEKAPAVKKSGKSSKKPPVKPKADELIPQYLKKGMNKEEIAKALGMSSREVSLIMEIKNIKMPGDKN